MATRRPLFLPEFSAIKHSKAPPALDSLRGVMAAGFGCSTVYSVCWGIMGMSCTGDLLVGSRSMKFPTSLDLNQPYQPFGSNIQLRFSH